MDGDDRQAPGGLAPPLNARPHRRLPHPNRACPPQSDRPLRRRSARPAIRCSTVPIFIVSSPRSGSSLLFETLAQGARHSEHHRRRVARADGVDSPNFDIPTPRNWASNRAHGQADVSPAGGALCCGNGSPQRASKDPERAVHRCGTLPVPACWRRRRRTPCAYPSSSPGLFRRRSFIYLYRDPRPTLASMMEAWRSGKLPHLCGNRPAGAGRTWSLLLIARLAGNSWPARRCPRSWRAQWAETTTRYHA